MSRVLILVTRQLTDDRPLFLGASATTAVLLLLLGAVVFLYPWDSTLHGAILLLLLPAVVGAGFLAFGMIQGGADESGDALPMLSTLFVTLKQIILARVITGLVCVVATVTSLAMVLSAAVIMGLLQWPKPWLPEGLIDLLAALLLIGAVCYLLGLSAGRRHAAVLRLAVLLLAVASLVSLVVIKGLGRPLAITFIPLIIALLAYQLVSRSLPRVSCVCVGFVVLTLTLIPLFWLRHAPRLSASPVFAREAGEMTISGEDLLRPLGERDPNSASFSISTSVCAGILRTWSGDNRAPQPAGVVIDTMEYLDSRRYGRPVYQYFGRREGIYYDRHKHLIVDYGPTDKHYVGPKGIAGVPRGIGRFRSLVVCRAARNGAIVFDRQGGCFYRIRANWSSVRPGPPVADPLFCPVDVTSPRSCSDMCSVRGYHGGLQEGILRTDYSSEFYLPVVEESGDISVLDMKSLTLRRSAGRLPRPHTLFGSGSSRPRDLLDYGVNPVVVRTTGTYAGLVVVSLSRQDGRATLAVFDSEGRPVGPTSSGSLSPWLLPAGYLIESLHPPALTLASFFAAYAFEAGATHRALFLMPNSFVALQRDRETSTGVQLLWALVFMMPAMVFAGFLGWRMAKDARTIGLSRRTRRLWLVGVLAFGLPAYIAYRLTRPRVVLTPCRNCGNARRVDMDLCHHCGHGWDTPQLDPPAWRVVDLAAEEASGAAQQSDAISTK